MNPSLSWEGSSSSGDLDLSYGIESDVRPTADIASLPRSIWGKASTNVGPWGVSARVEMDGVGGGNANIDVDADNSDADLSVHMVANADGVQSVEATKGVDAGGARVTVNPRYNVADESADVVVAYSNDSTSIEVTASADSQDFSINHNMGDTSVGLTASAADLAGGELSINHNAGDTQIGLTASPGDLANGQLTLDHSMDATSLKLTASSDSQEITVSQQVDANNRVSPTINNNGDISVAWERDLGDDNSLTATLKPNDSLDVEWNDNDWTANVNMPLDGASVSGANVSIKRDVNF